MGKNKSDDVKNKTDTKKSSINPNYEKTPAYTKSLASIVGSAAPKVNDFKENFHVCLKLFSHPNNYLIPLYGSIP